MEYKLDPIEVKKLLAIMEENRREQPSISTDPVSSPVKISLAQLFNVDLSDYSEHGNTIDRAIHHLDEALPNGQLMRASAAIVALADAVMKLRNWMIVKGYIADYTILDRFANASNGTMEVRQVSLEEGKVFQSSGMYTNAQRLNFIPQSESEKAVIKVETCYVQTGKPIHLLRTSYTLDLATKNFQPFSVSLQRG